MSFRLHGGADKLRGRGHPLTTHRARKVDRPTPGCFSSVPDPWNPRCRQGRGSYETGAGSTPFRRIPEERLQVGIPEASPT